MAVKFGKDGTLYCNTVRYNYKQARNMIADGTYGNISGTSVWDMYNVVSSVSPHGYKSYRCFYFDATSSQATSLQQKIPTLYKNHKYYISAYAYSADLQANGAIYLQDSSNNSLGVISLGQFYSAWTLVSNIITPTYDVTEGRLYIVEYTHPVYLSKFILIDLTDTFGAGNEPTKAWCDVNMREHEVYSNFGNVSNNVSYTTLSRYSAVNIRKTDYNYLELDSNSEPRDYMYSLRSYLDRSTGRLYSTSNFSLTNTDTYYFQIESSGYGDNTSYTLYFPDAEPSLGVVPLVQNETFNGGGGMSGWKRVSMYGNRASFSSGSYAMYFDFNNNRYAYTILLTGLSLVKLSTYIKSYNDYNGTSITINDINKEWCDRWIDGRDSPIIRIKDPHNTIIKFGGKGNYVELDYIEATGTQYIPNLTLSRIYTIEAEVAPSNTGTYHNIYDGENNTGQMLWVKSGPSLEWNASSTVSFTNNTRIKVKTVADGSNVYGYLNDVQVWNGSETSFGNTWNCALFNRGKAQGFVGKVYSMKIYNNGVLVRDFIPVLRQSDGNVGLYDKVNGTFYNNAGTGNFIYGNVKPSTFNDGGNPTDYDVICNDIEIHPEMNSIVMDTTGTIKCKKLVRTQSY